MSEFDTYPDIGEIFAQKARGRLQRASLSFSEKLEILDLLRKKVAPVVRAREARNGRSHAHLGSFEDAFTSLE